MNKKIVALALMAMFSQVSISTEAIQQGKNLWDQSISKGRVCADCHGTQLTQPSKHLKTRKIIKPMAASVNAERYTDPKKVEKWFKRNCKWTWGRECTGQEKTQILHYLKSL